MPCVGGRTFNFFSNLFAFLIIFRNVKSFDLFKNITKYKTSFKLFSENFPPTDGASARSSGCCNTSPTWTATTSRKIAEPENEKGESSREWWRGDAGDSLTESADQVYIQKTEFHKTFVEALVFTFFCISRVLIKRYKVSIVFLKKSIFEITILLKKMFGFF